MYFVDNPVYFPTSLSSIPLDTAKARLDSKECIEIKIVQWTQINSERAFKTLSVAPLEFLWLEHLPKCDEVTSGVLEEVLQKRDIRK